MAQSLDWLLATELTPELSADLDMAFVAPQDEFGLGKDLPLVPGGADLRVTEENKREYVAAMCEWKLRGRVAQQLQAFADGLHDFVPQHLLALFSAEELSLLISGATEVNVEDWRVHTSLTDLDPEEDLVVWFWELVGEMSPADHARLLQFATGSPAVPVNGFAGLEGVGGGSPAFTLSRLANAAALPTAATCFNLLRIPPVTSKPALERALREAMFGASEGFAFA